MSQKIIADAYPLSPMQEGMLYHYLAEENQTSYFEQVSFRVEGELYLSNFKLACNHVVEMNEALRTVINWKGSKQPMQVVLRKRSIDVKEIDLRATPPLLLSETLSKIRHTEQSIGFDLERGPLVRLMICHLPEGIFEIIWSFHHIIMDGWSSGIVWKEFFEAYHCLQANLPMPEKIKPSYKEYLKFLQVYEKEEANQFWHNYLLGFDNPTTLPTDFVSTEKKEEIRQFDLLVSLGLSSKLHEVARKYIITSNALLQLAWGLLLQKYTNSDDVLFGATIAGRPYQLAGIEEMVGLFINTIPVRLKTEPENLITELLERLKVESFQKNNYQHSSLVEIKAQSSITGAAQLFNNIFVFENFPIEETVSAIDIGLKVINYQIYQETNYDLTLIASGTDQLMFQFVYNPHFFKAKTIERMANHYLCLLEQIVEKPTSKVNELRILTLEELTRLLRHFNATTVQYPVKLVHQFFEEQVEKTPEKQALYFEEQSWTYRDLNQFANLFAHLLRKAGVSRECLVGVMVERSLEMVAGLLAILKAGGAYLPIDPFYPAERISYMLTDAAVSTLITQTGLKAQVPANYHGKVIFIDTFFTYFVKNIGINGSFFETASTAESEILGNLAFSSLSPEDFCSNLEQVNIPRDLVYVIYTSGSTGQPKGVALQHDNLANLLYFELLQTKIDYSGRMLQFTSLSFDVAFQEIFTPLAVGGTVYLITDEKRKDLQQMLNFLNQHEIEIISFPFTYLNFIFEDIANVKQLPQSLKHIITAGEQLIITENLQTYLKSRSVCLHNHYGPSETHVVTTLTVDGSMDLPRVPGIGRPISNVQIYILDHHLQPVPIGVVGEIYIAGIAVGRGYLHRPELTSEKFLANPFDSGLMYKSGDLGCWNEDGEIDFLGRVDYQVKIRGFRVETGEIEAALLNHPAVKKAVVLAKKDSQERKYLVGYLVLDLQNNAAHSNVATNPAYTGLKVDTSLQMLTSSEIRAYLLQMLPDYMVPSTLIFLKDLPLTPSGKVNRNALPEPDGIVISSREYVTPRNHTEEVIAKIWADVLDISEVGIYDNFFELGGHSLKATQIVSRIYKELQIQIPVRTIITTGTIARLIEETKLIKKVAYKQITPTLKQAYYPLSHAQRRLWFIYQLEENSSVYNMPSAYIFFGELDFFALKCAFQTVVERHETLRTRFVIINDEPVQIIEDNFQIEINYWDWQWKNYTLADLEQFVNTEVAKPFDLTKPGLIRTSLVKLANNQHLFIFTMHHIISDGWSNDNLLKEITTLYNVFINSEPNPLPPLEIQYRDYAAWQEELLQSKLLQEEEKYWLDQFTGELPVLNLPADYPRPIFQSFNGGRVLISIDKELTQALKNFANRRGVTLFMTLLATYKAVCYYYTGQEDLIIGTPVAGRPHHDLEPLIGFFVNTLAIRTRFSGEESMIDLLEKVKQVSLAAFDNQDYPFDLLVTKLNLHRDMGRSPLFDTMFNFLTANIAGEDYLLLTSLKFKPFPLEVKVSRFDLLLTLGEENGELVGSFEYCTDLFKQETIVRLKDHFCKILYEMITQPEARLNELNLLTTDEKYRLLYEFNDTVVNYPGNFCIHELIEAQAERTPLAVALHFEGRELTYRQLNSSANHLGSFLREEGVCPDKLVAIMADRSLEMVIGLLAILKAGGAYIPVDPLYPEERIKYMLENSKAPILLTQSWQKIPVNFGGRLIELDTYFTDSSNNIYPNLKNINTTSDLAYVIYTSGSTGRPKGACLQHGNLVNLLNFEIYKTNIDYSGRMLQFTSLSFDVSFQEIFTPLVAGGRVYLITDEKRHDPRAMLAYLHEHQIEIISFPFSYLSFIFEEQANIKKFPQSLKHIITAGEQLIITNNLREFLTDNPVFLHNHYGPSETHVATTLTLDGKSELPLVPSIGHPVSNVQIYILNQKHNLVPIGLVGEIYIALSNVGRGYWGQPELTAERYITNPFGPGQIYKTGDLGRWTSEGVIEFLGRKDFQVKIRGYRVETGEIEAVLLTHSRLKQVAVLAKKDLEGRNFLACYFTTDCDLSVADLRSHLAASLPDYMIPAVFSKLTTMPMTPNGKIDRTALLTLKDGKVFNHESVPPRNTTEWAIARIWCEVLSLEQVGVYDNFFESGGHSLKATQVMSRLRQEFNVDLPLKLFFTSPTIAEIAEKLDLGLHKAFTEFKRQPKAPYYPLSHAQKRLWVINQLENNISYNMPSAFILQGDLDFLALQKAFQTVVDRHDILRTRFTLQDGEPVQIVEENLLFRLTYFEVESEGSIWENGEDLTSIANKIPHDQKIVKYILEEATRPFNLTEAGLLRATLIKLQEKTCLFLFTMHHIITDGWSNAILVRELVALYEAFVNGQENPLTPLIIQYSDYAVWQADLLHTNELKLAENYWLEHFKGQLPILHLPTDFKRLPMRTYCGDVYNFVVDPRLSEELQNLAKKHEVTMFMLLFAAYNVLLHRYSGQEEIITGTPIAGRPHKDLEDLIGFFVNSLAIRTHYHFGQTFLDFLAETKETILNAMENQAYPFDLLVEHLTVERDLSRSPIFETMFAWQNTPTEQLITEKLIFIPIVSEFKVSRFDLILNMRETEGKIQAYFNYNTSLFKADTIARMSSHLVNLLKSITVTPTKAISQLEMLSDAEKTLLLGDLLRETRYPKEKTIPQLIEEYAGLGPEQIALIYGDEELTYYELNAKANQLARTLHKQGVTADNCVGVLTRRSLEMVIGLVGIAKAGGAFVPLDPTQPVWRTTYILEDAQIKTLVCQSELLSLIPDNYQGDVLAIDSEKITSGSKLNLPLIVLPENLLYVMYTSGSTGKPKGVEISHYSVIRLVKETNYLTITKTDRLSQISNYTFDGSTLEIWGALLNGAGLVLISADEMISLPLLKKRLEETKVNILFAPTAFFNNLADYEPELFKGKRKILFGGERASVPHVAKAYKVTGPGVLLNCYGPTESTVIATVFAVNENPANYDILPIGKPIAHSSAYILDQELQPVAYGVTGEIYLGWDGLARGYLNRPDLTAEKFIVDPFFPGGRLYKTGDLGRFLPDGNIEYLGRVDNQVKIRGFRIEPGEIEAAMLTHNAIQEVVVMEWKDSKGTNFLVGYFTAEKEVKLTEVKEYLQKILPEYMIPLVFIQLESFPLTTHGKIDRQALPDPNDQLVNYTDFTAPRNEHELQMARIWAEVLGISSIGIHDNFFDLGGYSLKATQILARVRQELEIEIPLKLFFASPTIAGIISVMGMEKIAYQAIKPQPPREYYPLSPAQRRIWIAEEAEPDNVAYNIPLTLILAGRLNWIALKKAISTIVERHEILRSHFDLINGEPVQIVADHSPLKIQYIDWLVNNRGTDDIEEFSQSDLFSSDLSMDDFASDIIINGENQSRNNLPPDLAQFILEDVLTPFDLKNTGLMRVYVVKYAENQHLLYFNLHHIIADGWSMMKILVKELEMLYNAYVQDLENPLPSLEIQYRDYAIYQNMMLTSAKWEKQQNYWLQQLAGPLPGLNLPKYNLSVDVSTGNGASEYLYLDNKLTQCLKTFSDIEGVTPFMTVLAIFKVMLSKITLETDIAIGTPVTGRTNPETENLVGIFLNTLLLRTNLSGDPEFRVLLARVKETVISAFENQDCPYEVIFEQLTATSSNSAPKLFTVLINYIPAFSDRCIEMDSLKIQPCLPEAEAAKFELELYLQEDPNGLGLKLTYRKDLFYPATIKFMLNFIDKIMHKVMENPLIRMSEIQLVDESTQAELMEDFSEDLSKE